jgi:hypothetical protein
MGCEGGEVEEEEAEVINWASKDSGGCKGQKFPSIHHSGALGHTHTYINEKFYKTKLICVATKKCENISLIYL